MTNNTVFHGTPKEMAALLAAIQHNCACTQALGMTLPPLCAPHDMLTSDQRALDGLLFIRRSRACLLRSEGLP
jgi:hypothetical protein